MLIVWLSELWLNQLGQLKERGEEMSTDYEKLQESFRKFLAASRVKVWKTSRHCFLMNINKLLFKSCGEARALCM